VIVVDASAWRSIRGLVHFRTLVTLRRVRVRVGLELRVGLVRVRLGLHLGLGPSITPD